MISSVRVGKILNDMCVRFSGEQCVHPFAVHVTSRTTNVSVLFSPSFSVVEGVTRIILSSSAIRARLRETGRELRRFQMIFLRTMGAFYPPLMYDIEGARQMRARNIAIQIFERTPPVVRQIARILAMPGSYRARSIALAAALP